jgi:hypothetical protein
VRSIVLSLTLLVSAVACEGTTDPFIGLGGTGGAITQPQATGNWSFVVHPTSALACSSGSLADSQVLTAHLEVLSDGTANSTTSFWQVPSPSVTGVVSGAVDLSNGRPNLSLSISGGRAMELTGTMTAAGSFTGTLRDPDPGLLPVFAACTYNTTGTKS